MSHPRNSLASWLRQAPSRSNGGARVTRAQQVAEAVQGAGHPARERLPEVLAILHGTASSSEAWESMVAQGLVPSSWVGDPRRGFLVDDKPQTLPSNFYLVEHVDHGRGEVRVAGSVEKTVASLDRFREEIPRVGQVVQRDGPLFRRAILASPPSVELMAALASDLRGVMFAEACARDLLVRLSPWGADPDAVLSWELPEAHERQRSEFPPWRGGHRGHLSMVADALHRSFLGGSEQLRKRWALAEKEFFANEYRLSCIGGSFGGDLLDATLWPEAARLGATVSPRPLGENPGLSPTPPWPESLVGIPFAELPDPYEPLLALVTAGYGVRDTLGPTLRLLAPGLAATTRPKG